MSYVDNVSRHISKNQYFVMLEARTTLPLSERSVYSGVDLGAGTVYYFSFPHGIISDVRASGFSGTMTEKTSLAAVTASEDWFYDSSTQRIYFCADFLNPAFGTYSVIFEMYFSTQDVLWHRDPTDDTTEIVKWTGCIKTAPTLSIESELQSFGFIPISPTTLTLVNDRETFQNIFHTISFFKSTAVCWHQCGNLDADDIARLLTGVVDANIKYGKREISFSIVDKIFDFDEKFSYGSNDTFDGATLGSTYSLDPDFQDKPIRTVYGRVRGFIPCNIDYKTDSPATTDNRDWIVGRGQGAAYWDSKSASIVAATSTTKFTISDADAQDFGIGDVIWVDKATDQWTSIIGITKPGSNTTIEVLDALSGTLAGMTIKKSYVRQAFIVNKSTNHWYELKYGRDYTETTFPQNTSGITLTATAESNSGSPTFDPNDMDMIFDVAGKRTLPTISGADFDALKNTACASGRNTYGSFQRQAIVLYDFLKTEFGLSESDMDLPAFSGLDQDVQWELAFAIPQEWNADFPTYKEVIQTILPTCFSKMFYDLNGKLTLRTIGQISTPDVSLEKEDMFDDLEIEYDSTNLCTLNWIGEFYEKYISWTYRAIIGLDDEHTHFSVLESFYSFQNGEANSEQFDFLGFAINREFVSKIVELETYITSVMAYSSFGGVFPIYFQRIYGVRSCTLRFRCKNALIDLYVGDSVQITRDDLPGFESGEDNSRYWTITKIEKGRGECVVTVDDQRGVQDAE